MQFSLLEARTDEVFGLDALDRDGAPVEIRGETPGRSRAARADLSVDPAFRIQGEERGGVFRSVEIDPESEIPGGMPVKEICTWSEASASMTSETPL